MCNVLILGAAGSIAHVAIDLYLKETGAKLTLYLRHSRRLKALESDRVSVIEGDVLNTAVLVEAMQGQDVVYANLAGDLPRMATKIIEAMHQIGLKRLIFVSSMGIYGEVPGERYSRVLDPYRDAAKVIEDSDLDYTVLRPGWFTNVDEVDYEITQKGQSFRGHDVSRKSLASLIVKLSTEPDLHVRESLGVNKPI